MPEESTFRKYACPKLKLSRLLLDNLFRILVRNCAKLEFRKSGIGQFCAKWLLRMISQIVVFFAQNWCAKKEKICVSFRKNCAKVLRMETLRPTTISSLFSKEHRCESDMPLFLNVGSLKITFTSFKTIPRLSTGLGAEHCSYLEGKMFKFFNFK